VAPRTDDQHDRIEMELHHAEQHDLSLVRLRCFVGLVQLSCDDARDARAGRVWRTRGCSACARPARPVRYPGDVLHSGAYDLRQDDTHVIGFEHEDGIALYPEKAFKIVAELRTRQGQPLNYSAAVIWQQLDSDGLVTLKDKQRAPKYKARRGIVTPWVVMLSRAALDFSIPDDSGDSSQCSQNHDQSGNIGEGILMLSNEAVPNVPNSSRLQPAKADAAQPQLQDYFRIQEQENIGNNDDILHRHALSSVPSHENMPGNEGTRDPIVAEAASHPPLDRMAATPLAQIDPIHLELDRARLQELIDQGLSKQEAIEQLGEASQTKTNGLHNTATVPDDLFSRIPPGQGVVLRLYLRSQKATDQERARELCLEHGLDYEAVRAVMRVTDDDSLADQEQRCRAYAEDQGWPVARVYVDDGVSGRRWDRPALQRMLAELQPLGISVVIVYDLDRAMRRLRYQIQLKDELDARHVSLVSLADGVIDTSTPEGILRFHAKGMVNEYQANTTARKVRDNLAYKAKHGGWVGQWPIGYEKDSQGRLVPSVDAPVVRLTFVLYASWKYTDATLADELNVRGATKPLIPRRASGEDLSVRACGPSSRTGPIWAMYPVVARRILDNMSR
jgi:DNA invertase Pin-like site-specific DNA recombinase